MKEEMEQIVQTIRVLPSERVGYAVVVQGIPMLGDVEYEYECLVSDVEALIDELDLQFKELIKEIIKKGK